MIPQIINVVLGIALTYIAILQPEIVQGRGRLVLAAAAVIVVCALWSRPGSTQRWFHDVTILCGVGLAALAIERVARLSDVSFWALFWVGTIVAVLQLWAILYRPTVIAEVDSSPTGAAGTTGSRA